MKTTINNHEITCSVEEFLQLMKIETKKEEKPLEEKAAPKKRKSNGRKGYMVFYPNGDHRIIALKPFCIEHGLMYNTIYAKTKDGKPYEVDGLKFQRRITNIKRKGVKNDGNGEE